MVSAPRSGRGGREFKSPHPDHETPGHGPVKAGRARGSVVFRHLWEPSWELFGAWSGRDRRKGIRHGQQVAQPLPRRRVDLPERPHAVWERRDRRAVGRIARPRRRPERQAPAEEDHRPNPQGGRRQAPSVATRTGCGHRRAQEVDDGRRTRHRVAEAPGAERGRRRRGRSCASVRASSGTSFRPAGSVDASSTS